MTSLLFVASKCGTTRKVLKSQNGIETIKRCFAISYKYASDIDARSRDRLFSRNNKHDTRTKLGNLSFGSTYSKPSRLGKAKLDDNNVLSSPFPDVDGFKGPYFHEYVFRNLDRWPDKTALICAETGRRYTFAQMKKISGRLATSLRKNNIRPGETIAIVLPNIPEYGLILFAASEAGLRATLVNPMYTVEEIRKHIKSSNAVAVLTVASKHPVVAASISDNPNIRLPIIVAEDGSGITPPGTIKLADLFGDHVEEFDKTGEKTGVDPNDTFLLPYSSGTSGLPKGVELTHSNVVANIKQTLVDGVTISETATEAYQEIVPLVLPLYHIYGLIVGLAVYCSIGAKVVILPKFSPDNFFKLLEENRATLLYVAPPLVQLLAHDERVKISHVETIKTICSGAAPISTEIIEKFKSRAPSSLRMIQGYGLTECSPVISMTKEAPFESTGCLVPNTQIRIVGTEGQNSGKNLGIEEVGELHVRGPQVMKGYYNNVQATADTMDGEWFKTGDLASYNEKGLLYIRGRLKELIKVKGYQVAPAELEHIIQSHENVADAAVIGVPHEQFGEIPKAFIVPKRGAKLESTEIKDYVAKQVSRHKHLGHVEFIEKIPKSAAGKILRRELQKL